MRILSAVVPNDLPFELNQCLRNGLSTLWKKHALACTEPFRIPLAGKVSDGDGNDLWPNPVGHDDDDVGVVTWLFSLTAGCHVLIA